MAKKKEKQTYYFSVEGETEEWYLDHLNFLISKKLVELSADFDLKLEHKKASPLKYMKSCNLLTARTVYHVFDHEGDDSHFESILKEMRDASKQKKIVYRLAYTNISFELWIILHKTQFKKVLGSVDEYLSSINSSYKKKFETLKKYKAQNNFKSVLEQISLNDVYTAIDNAKSVDKWSHERGYKEKEKYGYKWISENPALSLHLQIEGILKECLKRVNKNRVTLKLSEVSSLA